MHIDDFIKSMVVLENAYSNFKITEDETRMEFWYSEFKNVEAEVFEKSIKDVYRSEKYAPTIATIHEAIMRNYTWHQDSPTKAWAKVKGYVRRYGNKPWSWVFVELRDHHRESMAFVYALEQLGWKTLVSSQERDLVFMRKDFEEIYKEILEDDNRQKLEVGVLQNERQMLEAERQKILAEQEKKAIAGPNTEEDLKSLEEKVEDEKPTYTTEEADAMIEELIKRCKTAGLKPPMDVFRKQRREMKIDDAKYD